jgi:hypothetical protein
MKLNVDALVDELMQAENKEPFEFDFGGEDYILPPHIDIRAVAAMSAGRLDDALRMLLGPDQWSKLQASPKVFNDMHLKVIMDGYAKYAGGVEAGESSASTGS